MTRQTSKTNPGALTIACSMILAMIITMFAVPLPIQAQAIDYFNLSYTVPPGYVDAKTQGGAIGDGVTDDTNALQNAINLAAGSGQSVYVPPGKYLITGDLVLPNKVGLLGDYTGLSMITASGAQYNVGDFTYTNTVTNLAISYLVFDNLKVQFRGRKAKININNNIFFDSTDITTGNPRGIWYNAVNTSLIQDNIFLHAFVDTITKDNNWVAVDTYNTRSVTINRNVAGLYLGDISWLATQYAGYSTWSNLTDKLAYLQNQLGLLGDQGYLKSTFYSDIDNGLNFQNNIVNGSPNMPETSRDHVLYAKAYNNLNIVSNWIRGWPNDEYGGIKIRNAVGPVAVAANYIEDTGILEYIYDTPAVPFSFSNALIYRNYFHFAQNPISTNAHTGIFFWDQAAETVGGTTEGPNYYASNTFDCPPGQSGMDAGSLGSWYLYTSNVYTAGGSVLIRKPAGFQYSTDAPPPSLTAPYDSATVPNLSIPYYPPAGQSARLGMHF